MRKSNNSGSVLIISQYSFPLHKKNMNAFQRIYYGSEHANIFLLIRNNQSVCQEIESRANVAVSPFSNRLLFLLYAIYFALRMRFASVSTIITEPSGFALVGFVAKYCFGYRWIMDVWDRPMWRGRHEEQDKPPLRDRFVFWIMRHADIYLLSCLPRAAKDIDPNKERCLQLHNAIDLSGMANEPPIRDNSEGTLRLAIARFELGEAEGFHLLIKAAEILKVRKPDIKIEIHVLGNLDEGSKQLLEQSTAKSLFVIKGFMECSRSEYFKSMHVGLVPYMPKEDMSYIFPIKVLEHLSQGNVVIASNIPGLSATIKHGHNGLLFNPEDPDDLASQIEKLYDNYEVWRIMSLNALESVKKYDAVEKNKKIFETILKKNVKL